MKLRHALLALLVPGALACGFGKVGECNKLIQAANGQQDAVKRATAKLQQTSTTADIENLATTMENAAKVIAAVGVTDEKLKGFQQQYKTMLENAGKDCRDLVAAKKENNLTEINKAQTALSGLGGEEAKLISGINGYCSGP